MTIRAILRQWADLWWKDTDRWENTSCLQQTNKRNGDKGYDNDDDCGGGDYYDDDGDYIDCDNTDDDGNNISDDVGLFASDKHTQWRQGLR